MSAATPITESIDEKLSQLLSAYAPKASHDHAGLIAIYKDQTRQSLGEFQAEAAHRPGEELLALTMYNRNDIDETVFLLTAFSNHSADIYCSVARPKEIMQKCELLSALGPNEIAFVASQLWPECSRISINLEAIRAWLGRDQLNALNIT